MKIMNERLFGQNGQGGAFNFMQEQHNALSQKLDENMKELLVRIDAKKAESDNKVESVRLTYADLDRKVNRWSGAFATLQFLIMALLAYLGVRAKSGH